MAVKRIFKDHPLILFLAGLSALCVPAAAKERPNIVFFCVDDLRPELASYGADYIKSPNIDALAGRGRPFTRHYVQAPTCGASRYALLTGAYGPASNQALFQRAKLMEREPGSVPPSLPAWFRDRGYTTVSVGKVSHHPGGRGGPDWDAPNVPEMPESWDRALMPAGAWQHPRGAMHGLAHGEIRVEAGDMDVFQSAEGPDSIYPDGLITETALDQLEKLAAQADENPFFLAVGLIRPHLPFGAPTRYMEPYADSELPAISHPEIPDRQTTWHRSGEFMKYNRWERDPNTDPDFADAVRRHYAAAVTYIDALIGRLLDEVDRLGLRNDTVIVLWGDHGWHLGEHGVWGKHTLFEEALRSPLIVSYPGIPKPGEPTDAIAESVDLFPTLAELAGLPIPEFVDGESILPILRDPKASGDPAISYSHGGQSTIRTEDYRLIVHEDGFLELYDHQTPEEETVNIAADQPALASDLLNRLKSRLEN